MKSEYLGAVLTGQLPRSSHTVNLHRATRDGHASESEFSNAIAADQNDFINAQSNFAFTTGGQLDWLDLLRPVALTFSGFKKRSSTGEDAVGPVTRWFRTNTFYRKPLVESKLQCTGSELTPFFPGLNNGIAFFLGPYSFCNLVENEFYQEKFEMALDYCKCIARTAHELKALGYKCTLLVEPAVGYELSKNNSVNYPIESLGTLNGINGVHFPLVPGQQVIPFVEESKVNFIGIDCIYTDPIKVCTEKDLLLGVIDGNRTGIEDVELVKKQLQLFEEKSKFSGRYYTGPNDRLFDVPFETAIEKINLLAKIKR